MKNKILKLLNNRKCCTCTEITIELGAKVAEVAHTLWQMYFHGEIERTIRQRKVFWVLTN